MSAILVWCLASLLWTSSFSAADQNNSQSDALYKQIKDEKQSMMMFDVEYGPQIQQKSCRNDCWQSFSNRNVDECQCDKQCVAFGDCCLDYWQSCNASFIQAYQQRRIFGCFIPKLCLSNTTRNRAAADLGFQVITKCPKAFQNLRIKNACEKPEMESENVLPFVEGNDGRTYRNQYCAECYGVIELKRWKTSLVCPNKTKNMVKQRLKERAFSFTSEERGLIRETCIVDMSPPSGVNATPCRIVEECENTTQIPDYLKCKVYKEQIYSDDIRFKTFKNPHCAKCNGEDLFMLSAILFYSRTERDTGLGLLFDFSKSSQIYGLKEIQTEHKCKDDETYDSQIKECRSKMILKRPAALNWTCLFANETFPNSSAYITIHKNLSIFVASHNRIYNPNDYYWYGRNVTVCGNLTVTFLKTTMEKLDKIYTKAEYIITVVGLSLSILALLAVIITYFLFSELRSKLPGKIVINLAIALMLAQLVFLYDTFDEVTGDACVGIAVMLQYLYLAAFCWMNLMAFDVSRTFAGKSNRLPPGTRNKVFILCLIYAWGIPLIITGVTLIVNHSGTMNVAYGNNYYCWITNPIAMVIFFVVPVILMLLFNIIALVRVLVSVRRVRKATKKVRDESTVRQDARMCWKLTAVFGLTWILCLAAEHHILLRIVFVIFNSLQGVFIMVGFIMTKRVLNMYLKMAGKEPRIKSQATSLTRKSTLSTRSDLTRKISSAPLVDRKSVERRRDLPEHAVQVANDEDSPEALLVSSIEGPETKL